MATDWIRRLLAREPPTRIGTSITDEPSYTAICQRAADDPETFATFRSDPVYTHAVETLTPEIGRDCLDVIRRAGHLSLDDHIDRFKVGTERGGALLTDYAGVGAIAPTTLRYVKILSDLVGLFGSLAGAEIVEIGVGYGGQAKIINDYFDVRSYVLVDLPSALALARRFLEPFDMKSIEAMSAHETSVRRSDLLISNYAFSELTRGVQQMYVERLISGAAHGYLTCNFISDLQGIDSFSEAELLGMRTGSRMIPEEPLTHPANKVLVW